MEGGEVCPGKAQKGPSNFPRRKMKGKVSVGRLEGWKVGFWALPAPPLCTRSPEGEGRG